MAHGLASALTHSGDSRRGLAMRVYPHVPDRMRDRECLRPGAAGGDSSGPEPAAQADRAGPGGAGLRRPQAGAARRRGGRRQPPHGLALAAALRRGGHGRPAARQDPPARHAPNPARCGRKGGGADLRPAAASGDALDRTRPGLPLKPGRCGTMTHDYVRHGTTTLFAALNVLDGTVIGRCMQRHRHEEFIRFLNAVEREIPAGKLVHAVLDNHATHKHPKVKAWLARHPRWTFHFTPTSGSWLNAVETFFSALTRKRIRRGSFHSLVDLQAAIKRYLAEHNADPKPFVWTAPPAAILAKLAECP